MNSSRQRYSVCSEIPARRAICATGASLLTTCSTNWARCSGVNVDFFAISVLLLDTSTITYLRVPRDRSNTTARNLANAVKWYRKAAEQGYAKAQASLGVRYARGEGVAEDRVQALFWTILAARQGLARAVEGRAKLVADMNADDIARAEGLADGWKPVSR